MEDPKKTVQYIIIMAVLLIFYDSVSRERSPVPAAMNCYYFFERIKSRKIVLTFCVRDANLFVMSL